VREPPIVIIGAGTVGLAVGWRLAEAGERVVLFEKERAGRGASWQAAGMLAPDAEIGFEELELYALSRESLRRWPAFADELEDASGQQVDLRTEGTFVVADDPDSANALRRLFEFQKEQGLGVDWLTPEAALEREPFLAPRLAAAVFAPSDHQVDNRRLVQALRTAFERAGGELHEDTPVPSVHPGNEGGNEPPAVTTAGDDGNAERVEARAVVVAAGVGTRDIDGLEEAPAVRPVKGQMIELKAKRPFALEHVVRGPDAYLAPKSDGRLLVGATSEERGFDTRVTAGGLFELLEGARQVVPGVDELEVTGAWAGLRPAARDNAPLLGESGRPGIVMATGHYRHGVLLTPVTADEIAHLVLDGETSHWIEAFSPRRLLT
jgi:glycine oxidase